MIRIYFVKSITSETRLRLFFSAADTDMPHHNAYCCHHHAGKEAPAQRPYIRFEHRPYISHTSSLCAEAAPLVKILSTQTEYQFTLYRIPEEFVHTKPHFCAKKRRETRLFSCFIPYYPPQCDSTHFPSAYTPVRTVPRTPRSSPPWCRPADRGCPD